jgi:hypothetical protein
MGHQVTAVREQGPEFWVVEYFDDDDTARERGYGVLIPREAVHNRMGVYDITTPDDAILALIHEYHWTTVRPDPRDDPAVVQGWVTTDTPDSEPVHVYNARSGRDVIGAHRARWNACKKILDLRDPDGLLPTPTPDPAAVRRHREDADVLRWVTAYGDLPAPPRQTARALTTGGPDA